MKHKLLLPGLAAFALALSSGSLHAQCSAGTPTVTNVSVSCGSPATLNASGASGYQWWDQSSGGTMLGTGTPYVTPPLSSDTNYYVEGTGTSPQTLMGMPAYGSTYTGNVRGYWFVAPVDFTITGLDIPTSVSGLQNIAVLRFANTPPVYSATTNNFTTLFLTQNDATVGVISVNIPIYAGDTIGILGQAGTNNAYSNAGTYATTIAGQPVTLTRLGMQYQLGTTAPQDVWQEPTGSSISIVEMTYVTTCTSPRVQVGVTVTPINITAAATASAICSGDTTTLLGAGGTNYTWMPGNMTGSSVMVSPSTTTTYTVTGDDGGSCSNTATVTVTVNAPPVVNLGPDTTACGSVMFDAQNGGSTYVWSTGGTSQMETVTTSGNVAVAVTDGNGCTSSDTVMATINPNPVVNLGNDTTACGSVMLDAQNSGSTYTWSTGGSSQMEMVTSSGSVAVAVTDVNGCMNSDTVMVTINSTPVVNLGPDTTACGSVMLDAQNSGSMYAWSTGGSSQMETVTASGNIAVAVTDTNGCMGSDTVMVTINANPTVAGTAPSSNVCVDDAAVTLTGTPSGGAWSGPGVTGSSFSPTTAGTGAQTLTYNYTDANGCSGSATVTITVSACTGVAEQNAVNGISVFPNPNNGTFNVTSNVSADDFVIVITDEQGRQVYASEDANVQAGFAKQVSLETQASGLYFMRITANGKQTVYRIAVQK